MRHSGVFWSLFNAKLVPTVTDWTRNSQTPREGGLGPTEVRTADPLPMIPHEAETKCQ